LDKAKKAKDSEKFAEELEERRREVRRKLRESSDDLDPVEINDGEYILPRDLVVGDKIIIANIGKRAVVTRLPDKKGLVGVRTGQVDMRTSIDNIRLDDGKDDKKPEKKVRSNTVRSTVVSFSPEIDLRGKTGDEAWYLVDKYLDDAMMASVQSVRLIHGKGTGALKNALWQYLKADNRIKSFRIGAFGEGDTGVTVVELK
ncbi:MAG: Smr/MutS family protein, partial [Clostridia bacterium]|nr:Smr/MutS family protein [Clostridia bacterium]